MTDRISLFRPPEHADRVDADEIADWLGGRVDAEVRVREALLPALGDEDLARAFARARVLSPYERETGNEMLGIVRYEERAFENPERAGGVLYDGFAVRRALNARLDDPDLSHARVALVDRALATWGDHDGRWHKRVAVPGQPALVSVPGLYEAPAKPEAYYREKQRRALLTGDAPPREVLENEVDGDFLVPDDPRTTEALKGYVLQAIHYLDTGEAFCSDPDCRLYDAHRQSGLVRAQLRDPEFCADHAERYDA